MSEMEMPNEASPEQSRAKGVLIGFGLITMIGLALAGWYVGGRILAIQKVHAAATLKPVTATPAPGPPLIAIPVPAAPIAQPQEPAPGEIYLQLAALGPNSTKEYMKTLEAKGLHAQIAPSPIANVYRILMGPYPDRSAREKEQQALQAAGIETIVQMY